MKCARIGNADTFEKIVFAFASEDSDIRLDELGIMNLSSTGEKRKSRKRKDSWRSAETASVSWIIGEWTMLLMSL